MDSGSTAIAVTAIVASAVIVIAVIICTAFLYSKYLRRLKPPSVHPSNDGESRVRTKPEMGGKNRGHYAVSDGDARAETKSEVGGGNRGHDTGFAEANPGSRPRFHPHSNVPQNIDRPSSQQPLLNLQDGRIIKPQMCISQEMLTVYRSLWMKTAGSLLQPPVKVPQLYGEDSMVLYQEELTDTFRIPKQRTRSKIPDSRSCVNPCSSLTNEKDLAEELRLAVDTLKLDRPIRKNRNKKKRKNGVVKATPRRKSAATSGASDIRGIERSPSRVSRYSEDIVDRFVQPGDVYLGEL